MQLNFLGLTFHLYGLVLGLGIVLAIWLGEWLLGRWVAKVGRAAEAKYWANANNYWQVVAGNLVGGVAGARIWHLLTDLELYWPNLAGALLTWQGGLSILGAVLGGALGIWLTVWLQARSGRLAASKISSVTLSWLDLAVLVVPLAQAIGRLGNYFNQELYGLPSNLPWAIEIDPAHRLPAYLEIATYHPLFLYEMIGLGILALWLWRRWWVRPTLVGRGELLATYLVGYGLLRFGLDFLRLEKLLFFDLALTLNQVILLSAIGTVILVWRWPRWWPQALGLFLGASFLAMVASAIYRIDSVSPQLPQLSSRQAATMTEWRSLANHSLVEIELSGSRLLVEVVTTPASISQGLSGRSEIGSDGMLFILPGARRDSFWMKDMQFDLDLIWLSQGEVVGVTKAVPAPEPGQALNQLPVYPSPQVVDMVLEVEAGRADQLEISLGDRLTRSRYIWHKRPLGRYENKT